MVLLLLTFCLLLLLLWESVIVLCFVVCYFMSILVLQSSWWGRGGWLLCFICLPGVSWWLSRSSSRCHGVVCGLWLWYFLIILTFYFLLSKPDQPKLFPHKHCIIYIFSERYVNAYLKCVCFSSFGQGPDFNDFLKFWYFGIVSPKIGMIFTPYTISDIQNS